MERAYLLPSIEQLVDTKAYLGLARLMRLHSQGVDMAALGRALLDRALADPSDLAAIMDAAIVVQFLGDPVMGLALQQEALTVSRHFVIPSELPAQLRLLVLMAPGELMANVPIECLLEHSDIELHIYYAATTLPSMEQIPEHDVLFVAMSESEANRPILQAWLSLLAVWPKPIINRPEGIPKVARDVASNLLHTLPGIVMPPTYRIERQMLLSVINDESVDDRITFPLIIRPVDSHAGHDLIKVMDRTMLTSELERVSCADFFVSPFIDYSDLDGQFRKYRVMLIDGVPYPAHMAISDHWMIHYMNAGMMDVAEKRAEEAQWFATFDHDFALKHRRSLNAIYETIGLDYLGIDCAQTQDGQLLVFEIDHAMVVHDVDPPLVFPYKHAPMQRIFDAFHQLLRHRAKG